VGVSYTLDLAASSTIAGGLAAAVEAAVDQLLVNGVGLLGQGCLRGMGCGAGALYGLHMRQAALPCCCLAGP